MALLAAMKGCDRDEQGSITVLAVFLLPIMLLLTLLLANVGQAIFEKVRLQNTVDAATLAAATVQSAGLNEIADLNFEMDLEYIKFIQILTTAPFWDSYGDGNGCVSFFKKVFKALRTYQDRANTYYARMALYIAQSVSRENLPSATLRSVNPKDSKLMEFTRADSRNWFFLYRICSCCPCGLHCQCECCPYLPVAKWISGLAGLSQYRGPHDGRLRIVNRGILLPAFGSVKTKRGKKSSPTTYSAFKITQPAKDFIFAAGVFGKMESLTAYAAAKPAGGNVKDGVPDYKPVMVMLRSLKPRPRVDNLMRFEH